MIRDWSTFDNWAKKLVGSAKSQHWRLPRGEFEQNYDQILIKNGFALTTTRGMNAQPGSFFPGLQQIFSKPVDQSIRTPCSNCRKNALIGFRYYK